MAEIQLYQKPWPAEPLGRLAADGDVYSASSREPVGRVDEKGVVYDKPWPGEPVGRFEADGQVYNRPWPAEPIGSVDASGAVYRSGLSEPVGRVDPPSVGAGAALLLLLLNDDPTPQTGFLKARTAAAAGALIDQAGRRRRDAMKAKMAAAAVSPTAADPAPRAEEIQPLQRVIGVSKFPAPNISLASDSRAVTTLQLEGHGERTHQELNTILVDQRSVLHDGRAFIAVVGGSRHYILEALRSIPMADLFICCADERTLRDLGVPVIDASWRPGGEPLRYEAFYDIVNKDDYAPTAPQVVAQDEGGGG